MGYIELLKQNKVLRQLSLLQIFAYFGAWFSHVAIYTLLIQFNASSLLVAFVVAMNFAPSILLSPFMGSLLDRLNLKKLMVLLLLVEVGMTMMFFTIKSIDDIYMLMLFIFIRMASASMFFTSEMTLLPKLLPDNILSKANEIHSIIWSFTFSAGMALGGIVVYHFGVNIAFSIDILFFFISIIILINTKISIPFSKSKQNIFLETLDMMFKSQASWASHISPNFNVLSKNLVNIGIDMKQLLIDIKDPNIKKIIDQDIADGKILGATKTPSYYVNGRPLQQFGLAQLKSLINEELNK